MCHLGQIWTFDKKNFNLVDLDYNNVLKNDSARITQIKQMFENSKQKKSACWYGVKIHVGMG